MAPGRINSVPSGFMEGIKYAGEQQEVPLESEDLPRVFCVTELAVGQREPGTRMNENKRCPVGAKPIVNKLVIGQRRTIPIPRELTQYIEISFMAFNSYNVDNCTYNQPSNRGIKKVGGGGGGGGGR